MHNRKRSLFKTSKTIASKLPTSPLIFEVFPDNGNTEIDIVFVHGLGDTPQETWGGRDIFSSWLRHVQKQMPLARIVACGFDVIESVNINFEAVEGQSSQLLRRLDDLRKKDNNNMRPLILVAHSLGGLILKFALMSFSIETRNDIAGIIFLATPQFTKIDEWADFGSKIAKAFAERTPLTAKRALPLFNLNQTFEKWTKQHKAWIDQHVFCFGEALPVYRVGMIVPKNLAILKDTNCQTHLLHTDHFNIARCGDACDPQFQQYNLILQAMSRTDCIVVHNLPTERSFEHPKEWEKSSLRIDGREILEQFWDNRDEVIDRVSRGLNFEDLGQYDLAEKQFESAITKLAERKDTRSDTIRLFCMDKKAMLLMDQCKYEKADHLSFETLKIRKRENGKEDLATLLTAGNRARILRYVGKYDDAYALLRDHLDSIPESPFKSIVGTVAVSILAKILKEKGILEVSELLSRDVVRACEYHLGHDHPFTYNRLSDLGVVLSKRKQFQAAEEITRLALNGLGNTLGAMHPHTLRTSKRLGSYLRFQQRLDEAQAILQTTLLRQNKIFTRAHPDTLSTRYSLAAVYTQMKRFEDSKCMLEEVLKDRKEIFGGGHPDSAWTQKMLQGAIALRDGTSRQEKLTKDFLRFSIPRMPNQDVIALRTLEFQCPLYEPDKAYPDEAAAIEAIHCGDRSEDLSIAGKDLRYAAATGHVDIIQNYLQRNVNINAKGGYYGDSLQAAAFSGREAVVKILLKRERQDVNVNSQGGIFGTPLRAAALGGHEAVIHLLLEAGATSTLEQNTLGSALEAALIGGHKKVVELLIASMPPLTGKSGFSINTLIRGMLNEGNVEMLQLLVSALLQSNKSYALDSIQLDCSSEKNAPEIFCSKYTGNPDAKKILFQSALAAGNLETTSVVLNAQNTEGFNRIDSPVQPIGSSAANSGDARRYELCRDIEQIERNSRTFYSSTEADENFHKAQPSGTANKRESTITRFSIPVISEEATTEQSSVVLGTSAVSLPGKETAPTSAILQQRKFLSRTWGGRSNKEKSSFTGFVRRNWRRMSTQ